MNYIIKLMVTVSLSSIINLHGSTVQKQSALYLDEISVNGIIFIHRQEYSFATLSGELWAVNGTKVEKELYQHKLTEAHAAERAEEERLAMRLRERKEQFIRREREALLHKLLDRFYQEIVAIRKKLSDVRLQPFIVFSVEGIPSQQELTELDTVFLPHVKRICLEDQQVDFAALQQLTYRCERFPEHLQICYEQTIARARVEAHDTKLLKELLEMLESS
jgi:hypothetical protein